MGGLPRGEIGGRPYHRPCTILLRHYGFTDEELDFIINYDIKYRMGGDADEVDE